MDDPDYEAHLNYLERQIRGLLLLLDDRHTYLEAWRTAVAEKIRNVRAASDTVLPTLRT